MGELISLADQINSEHQKGEQAARSAIGHAIRAGELLIQAKAQVKHGEWRPWIEQHLAITHRQVQKYMRVADHREQLANASENSHLSVDAALAVIADHREPDEKPLTTDDHMELASRFIIVVESFLDSRFLLDSIKDMDLPFNVELKIMVDSAQHGGGPLGEVVGESLALIRSAKIYLRYYMGQFAMDLANRTSTPLGTLCDLMYRELDLKPDFKTVGDYRILFHKCISTLETHKHPEPLPDNPSGFLADLLTQKVDIYRRAMEAA